LTILLAGCSKPEQEVEKTKAEVAVNGFYLVKKSVINLKIKNHEKTITISISLSYCCLCCSTI